MRFVLTNLRRVGQLPARLLKREVTLTPKEKKRRAALVPCLWFVSFCRTQREKGPSLFLENIAIVYLPLHHAAAVLAVVIPSPTSAAAAAALLLVTPPSRCARRRRRSLVRHLLAGWRSVARCTQRSMTGLFGWTVDSWGEQKGHGPRHQDNRQSLVPAALQGVGVEVDAGEADDGAESHEPEKAGIGTLARDAGLQCWWSEFERVVD